MCIRDRRLIAVSAFSPRAAAGAAGGLTMRRILRMGIGRGVFTNEAGLGSTPIAAACSSNEDPVRQGLVTMTGTFLDTIVISVSYTHLFLISFLWASVLRMSSRIRLTPGPGPDWSVT